MTLSPGASAVDAAPSEVHERVGRLASLDVFRGLTVAGMIVVNNQGSELAFWPLKHAAWNGWTPTDLVFPFFLFIMGASLVLSLSGRVERGESRRGLALHVLRRSATLFGMGLFLNGLFGGFHLATWRVEGVLQRIALCYGASAALLLGSSRQARWIFMATCLLGYWLLLRFVPVPGFGVPGRDVPLLDPVGNLTAWIDRALFAGHLDDGTSDPEGLLSTLPAVVTTLFGVLAGELLRTRSSSREILRWMFSRGAACAIAGLVASLAFPINKKLWTSSFVLTTAGLALIALGLCYFICDVRRRRGPVFEFARVFGANAIAAYIFSESLQGALDAGGTAEGVASWQERLFAALFVPIAPAPVAALLYALAFLLVCWGTMGLLYRRGIFIKV